MLLRTDGASGCRIQKSDQFLQVVCLGDDDTLGGRHCNASQIVDIGQIFLPVDLHCRRIGRETLIRLHFLFIQF